MADSWEDRRSRKRDVLIPAIIVVFLIIGGFFVYNNIDTFLSKGESSKIQSTDKTKSKSDVSESDDLIADSGTYVREKKKNSNSVIPEKLKVVEKKNTPVEKVESVKKTDKTEYTVRIPTVECILADKKDLKIQISFKLFCTEKKVKEEILFKRDVIKLAIIKILGKKLLSEIVVESLRKELKNEINTFLKQGKVHDVEFLDFKPVHN